MFLDVHPREFHVPASRIAGADPVKLQRQIARYGKFGSRYAASRSLPWTDGALMLYDGVTRATRVAKFLPGTLVRVEVVDDLKTSVAQFPTIADVLP